MNGFQMLLNVLIGLHAEFIETKQSFSVTLVKWKDRNTGFVYITEIHTEDYLAKSEVKGEWQKISDAL